MPTYEYDCEKCGRFEIFQQITAPALDSCPTCGSKVKRLISNGAGIIFKGKGFYATDYRKKEYKDKEKLESSSTNTCPKESSCGVEKCPAKQ